MKSFYKIINLLANKKLYNLLTNIKLFYKILYGILILFYKKTSENCHFSTILYNWSY